MQTHQTGQRGLLGREAAEAEEVLQPLSLCLLPVEEEAAVLLGREAAEAEEVLHGGDLGDSAQGGWVGTVSSTGSSKARVCSMAWLGTVSSTGSSIARVCSMAW